MYVSDRHALRLKRCLRDIAGFPCVRVEPSDRGPRCVTSGPDSLVSDEYQQGRMQDPWGWFDARHVVYEQGAYREMSESEKQGLVEWGAFSWTASMVDESGPKTCIDTLGE